MRVQNKELATAAGVHVKAVSQWRHDKQRPTEDNLAAIAPLLQTSTSYLRDGNAIVTTIREVGWKSYDALAPLVLPNAVRAHAHRILASLAEEDADEHSVDMARRLLLDPVLYTVRQSDGGIGLISEAEIIRDMNTLAEWARGALRARRDGTPASSDWPVEIAPESERPQTQIRPARSTRVTKTTDIDRAAKRPKGRRGGSK